ncbi:unnamed protein product [Cuscuta epithymum]|uniref:Uncharacterized protein n=1 Tax=Cuscuta epithymum TaxID=186058 RepID=A0AAV0EG81_9ASTE|nr:unnamed protein product [Cuscuta epithymum]
MKMFSARLFFILLMIPVLLVSAAEDCSGDSGYDGRDRVEARNLKFIAFAAILAAGFLGVNVPNIGKKFPMFHPDSNLFFLVKAFAAGVILATGFIHVLPDAFEALGSPCLPEKPWSKFPFPAFVAMVAALITMMVDLFATSYYSKAQSDNKPKPVDEESPAQPHAQLPIHTHASHGHAHGPVEPSGGSDLTTRRRVISMVLEIGIIVHSIIIGISLGASVDTDTIKPLLVALVFHQLFEGIGLGGCIAQAQYARRATILMALFFCFTTPIGIATGFWISSNYNENSPTALIVEGLLNSASAGILIYMALVDLIAADFMSDRLQRNLKLQIGANTSLLLGAGLMSLLAIWA